MNPSPAEICQFILDTFNEDDLELFCSDHFPEMKGEFVPAMPLRIKVQRLVDWCRFLGDLQNLTLALEKARPDRFKEWFADEAIELRAIQSAAPGGTRCEVIHDLPTYYFLPGEPKFNEMVELCMRMHVDVGDLAGVTRPEKAHDLTLTT